MILLRFVLTAVLCGTSWVGLRSTARAQPTPVLTGLNVLLHVPEGSGLRERVIGQVSDLRVVIDTVAEDEVPPPMTTHVTFDFAPIAPIGWRITIRDYVHDQTETRDVLGEVGQPLAQSAVDEAAALVVRVTLQSMLRDVLDASPTSQQAEVPTTETTERAPVAPVIAVAPAPEPTTTPAPSHDPNAAWRLWLGAGAQVALADHDLKLWPTIDLWLGVKRGALTLGVQAGYGVQVTSHNAAADLAMARHALLVMARRTVVHGEWGDVGAWAQLGTHVFVRQTERVADGWQALPAQTSWTPAAGLGGQCLLALWKGVSLGFSLGAHVQVTRPVVRVMGSPGGATTLLRGMLIAPVSWLSLEMVL